MRRRRFADGVATGARAVAAMGMLLATVGCAGAADRAGPADPALEQVRTVLETIAPSRDADDLAERSRRIARALRDSVSLTVKPAADGRGWTAVATHVRLGPTLGCALSRSATTPAETPAGTEVPEQDEVVCDTP